MNNSTWKVPDWETSHRATLGDTDKYLYDIRNVLERLRRTVAGMGTVIIIILVALTWFV